MSLLCDSQFTGANTMGQSRTTSSDDTAAASCTERGARVLNTPFWFAVAMLLEYDHCSGLFTSTKVVNVAAAVR